MQKSRTIVIFTFLAVSLSTSSSFGQKKLPVKTLQADTVVAPGQSDVVPVLKDIGLVVRLDEDGNAEVGVQVSEDSNKVSAQDLSRIYDYFSPSRVSAPKTVKTPFDPVIIVEAVPSLGFGKILDVIKPLQRSGDNKIKIAVGENGFLIVPGKIAPSQRANIRPNPLILIVELQDSGIVTINNEPAGSIADLQPLSDKLKAVFRSRMENGVFRETSNEIESTVNIKVPDACPFGDVKKLVGEISGAGSDRIFYYLEPNENTIFMIKKTPGR